MTYPTTYREPDYQTTINRMLSSEVLAALDKSPHGLTSPQLWANLRLPWSVYEHILTALHDDRRVIVTRDSSAGSRHADQWGGIVRVQIRPKNL